VALCKPSTTRLHDVCTLQDLNALPRIAANASPQTSLQPCTPPLPSVAQAAFTGPTQTTNTSSRALYDKLAKHAGFIVYWHEL
jgi:hypothetical protein